MCFSCFTELNIRQESVFDTEVFVVIKRRESNETFIKFDLLRHFVCSFQKGSIMKFLHVLFVILV